MFALLAPWFQGFVKWRGDVYKGEPAWADFFAVARAYTISFYKSPDDARNAVRVGERENEVKSKRSMKRSRREAEAKRKRK